MFSYNSLFLTAIHLADKNIQRMANPSQAVLIRTKLKLLIDGYRKMLDQSFSKCKDLGDLGDTLEFLPGVVVQKHMSMQGMADLYRMKPDLLERLIKSPIESLRLRTFESGYTVTLTSYLSGFLDQDRSQLHHRDPMLHHISVCRHFLSLSTLTFSRRFPP